MKSHHHGFPVLKVRILAQVSGYSSEQSSKPHQADIHSMKSWLVNGDPYKSHNGLLQSLYNWLVFHPFFSAKNPLPRFRSFVSVTYLSRFLLVKVTRSSNERVRPSRRKVPRNKDMLGRTATASEVGNVGGFSQRSISKYWIQLEHNFPGPLHPKNENPSRGICFFFHNTEPQFRCPWISGQYMNGSFFYGLNDGRICS